MSYYPGGPVKGNVTIRGGSIPQNQKSLIAIHFASSGNEESGMGKQFLFYSIYDSFDSDSGSNSSKYAKNGQGIGTAIL